MSRRARTRPDKRAEAARLAKVFADGFSLVDDETPDLPDDWDGHGEDPHGRQPIGPVNVAPTRNPESHA